MRPFNSTSLLQGSFVLAKSSNSPNQCNCCPKLTDVSCAFCKPDQWDTGLLKMQLDSDLTQVKAIYNQTTIYSDVSTYFVPGICWGQWYKGLVISYNIYSYISYSLCLFFFEGGDGRGRLTKGYDKMMT